MGSKRTYRKWLWDWYVPVLSRYLLLSNTVVSTNRGSMSWSWIRKQAMKIQFLFLKDSSSFLIYGQSTGFNDTSVKDINDSAIRLRH
jgi:hypothetical protein